MASETRVKDGGPLVGYVRYVPRHESGYSYEASDAHDLVPVNVGSQVTLRDWFAGQALTHALKVSTDSDGWCDYTKAAERAYSIADVMLTVRERHD